MTLRDLPLKVFPDHGTLAAYDLPDLRALCGNDRLEISEPVDATGAVIAL